VNLTSADLAKLAASGISPELEKRAQLRRVDSAEGARLVGRNGSDDYSGLIFPYIWPGETGPREYRLRRDRPEIEYKDGKPHERNKYLTAPGRGNLLYLVPGTVPEWLADPSLPVAIAEGEKKSLALLGLLLGRSRRLCGGAALSACRRLWSLELARDSWQDQWPGW
jgi:hypothetical protein